MIASATGAGSGLRCAFYEFANEDVMGALKAALDRGVDLELLVDTHHDSQKIDTHGLRGVTTRAHVTTPYNRFIIGLEGSKPKPVWTGSTNISDSGSYGQANVGHLVHDEQIAGDYLAYWTELHTNPTRKPLVAWTSAHNPDLKHHPTAVLGCVFSAQAASTRSIGTQSASRTLRQAPSSPRRSSSTRVSSARSARLRPHPPVASLEARILEHGQ